MVKGIVDRIEGNYAVVEFTPALGEIFFSDIELSNLDKKVSDGDVLFIFSVNGISLEDESRCVYKDIARGEVLKKFLEPLQRKVSCEIEINEKEKEGRSEEVNSLINSLFSR